MKAGAASWAEEEAEAGHGAALRRTAAEAEAEAGQVARRRAAEMAGAAAEAARVKARAQDALRAAAASWRRMRRRVLMRLAAGERAAAKRVATERAEEAEAVEGFTPSSSFAGARPGKVFGSGAAGVGYYDDLLPTLHPAAAKAGVDAGAAWAEEEAEADRGEASRCAVVEAEAEARAREARARAAWCTAAARWQWMRKGELLRFTVARRAAAERVAAERAAAAVQWQRMQRRAGFFPGFCELLRHAAARRAAVAATFWRRLRRKAFWRLTREAAELAPVIAALEWRFECEARSALARLADVFSSGDTLHQPGPDGDASGPQDAWIGCAASRTVPRAWGWAAGRQPVPGRGRRRPHMRWRARRESIYIRCSPSMLLQQCGRGMLDVRMVTPRPGG